MAIIQSILQLLNKHMLLDWFIISGNFDTDI